MNAVDVPPSRPVDLVGPLGPIEGLLTLPSSPPVAAAVLCHAHPLYGGIMRFKLLHRAANALAAANVAVLRFHFRGVGHSAGTYDHGRGEQDDCRAALSDLVRRVPDVPLLVGGFSFGAGVALSVATDDSRVVRAFALGLPLRNVPARPPIERLAWPCLFIQGEADQFGSGPELEQALARLPVRHTLQVVGGSDHFFTDHYEQVTSILTNWAASRPWESS